MDTLSENAEIRKKLCAQLSLPKGARYDFFEIVFMEYYLREVAEKREK